MDSQKNQPTDEQILTLLKQNEIKGWELLYDKYSPAMFGIIYNLYEDAEIAELIMLDCFLELKEKKILTQSNEAICSRLLKHTYKSAVEYLKLKNISTTDGNVSEAVKLIHLFCREDYSLQEVAVLLNMKIGEVKNLLHQELVSMRQKENEHYQIEHQQHYKQQ